MNYSGIVSELFRSSNPIKILENLKLLDYDKASRKIKQSINYPLSRKILFHDSSLPTRFSDLRKSKQLKSVNNLEGELAWFVNSLSNFTDKINLFIEKEKNLQQNILLDDYETSKLILD